MEYDAHIQELVHELRLSQRAVRSTIELLDEDATVPFIARYRKEATGGLDETQIAAVRDRVTDIRERDRRRENILTSLEEQGVLTEELKGRMLAAQTLREIEDLYLPYRPKRRTRATIAREKGLEPLAGRILNQEDFDPLKEANRYVSLENEVGSSEEALQYARDIVAEWIAEDAELRHAMRDLYRRAAVFSAKVARKREQEAAKYRDYFDWSESASSTPSHRILAVFRGASEGLLSFHIRPDEPGAIGLMERKVIRTNNRCAAQLREAIRDSYTRLLAPSMETELKAEMKKRADTDAVRVFATNLREILLSPPLGRVRVMGADPGLRSGCKLVCLDEQGGLRSTETIYPLAPHHRTEAATTIVRRLCTDHRVEAIAIGNGTGGREALAFFEGLNLGDAIPLVMVEETGASVYSASEVAREEFPDHDVTVRGAVSIGRRLVDPLSELVKIDPKSLGIGQYQHDVDPKLLKRSLDDVVTACVNAVGVEVNTASKELLRYVSGMSDRTAAGIIAYRSEHGSIRSRIELRKAHGMGPKSFEQAAGFLRIRDGDTPLDASAVHPESYHIVEQMAKDLGAKVRDLMQQADLRARVSLERYVTDRVGMPTLADIMTELSKPGRDPRPRFQHVRFAKDIAELEDLKPGMVLSGVVTNVTAFGAFVDIGVHHDGLVHISQMADHFVKDPHDVARARQAVTVTVLDVDLERKRVSLSMKDV